MVGAGSARALVVAGEEIASCYRGAAVAGADTLVERRGEVGDGVLLFAVGGPFADVVVVDGISGL
jgi:hypothetical protein